MNFCFQSSIEQSKRADLSSLTRHARSSSSILTDTNNHSMKSPSKRFVGHIHTPTNTTCQRTSRTPSCCSLPYDEQQENIYVNAAPRLSDSDSSSELPYQRMLTEHQQASNEVKNNCSYSFRHCRLCSMLVRFSFIDVIEQVFRTIVNRHHRWNIDVIQVLTTTCHIVRNSLLTCRIHVYCQQIRR
jgi:hypothetical protein